MLCRGRDTQIDMGANALSANATVPQEQAEELSLETTGLQRSVWTAHRGADGARAERGDRLQRGPKR